MIEITINDILVQNALLDLCAAINIITQAIMQYLNITNIRPNPIFI